MAKWKNQSLLDAALDQAATADEVAICYNQPGTWYEATNPAAWAASIVTALGAAIRPTARNGCCYQCTTGGTTGATEPTWPTTPGNTVTDGTVVWTCRTSYALANTSLTSADFTKANGPVPAYTAWVASTVTALGAMTVPTAANGYCYEATTAGTTGSTQPTWPTTPGNTVTDGTVVWTCRLIQGRQQTMAQKTNITIHTSGTATHIALMRSSDKTLLMTDQCSSQALTAGNLATINTYADVIQAPV